MATLTDADIKRPSQREYITSLEDTDVFVVEDVSEQKIKPITKTNAKATLGITDAEGTLADHETRLDTLEGTGEGSVAKAIDDYAIPLVPKATAGNLAVFGSGGALADGSQSLDNMQITLYNQVKNGNFATGDVTNFSVIGSPIYSVVDGILKFTGTGLANRFQQKLSTSVGDKILRMAMVKANSSLVGLADTAYIWTAHSGSGNYELLTHIRTVTVENRYVGVVDNRTSGWDEVDVKYVMAFNLTTIFGAGYEPTIYEFKNMWYGLKLDYIEGKYTVNTKQIMNYVRYNALLIHSKMGVDDTVKGINHRGYNTIAPENTLPAFVLSKKYGFTYVETDVRLTSDNVPVLMHLDYINDVARNPDGTELSSTVYIADITYAQALEYDYGIWKSEEYAGTKIPTFKEFITLCKKINLRPYIELKIPMTQVQIDALILIVKNLGMLTKVTWISFITDNLAYILNTDAHARVGKLVYGYTTAEIDVVATALNSAVNNVFLDMEYSYFDQVTNDYAQSKNMDVELWIVDSSANMISLAEIGATGFTTNNLNITDVLGSMACGGNI